MEEISHIQNIIPAGKGQQITLPPEVIHQGLELAARIETRLNIRPPRPRLVHRFLGIQHTSYIDFSLDGNFGAVVCTDPNAPVEQQDLTIWNIQTGEINQHFHQDVKLDSEIRIGMKIGRPTCVAVSPGIAQVIVGYGREVLRVWEYSNNNVKILVNFESDSLDPVSCLSIFPGGKYAAVASMNRISIQRLDNDRYTKVWTKAHSIHYPNQVATSLVQDTLFIVAGGTGEQHMQLHAISLGQNLGFGYKRPKNIVAVAHSPKQEKVITLDMDGMVTIWSVTGQLLASWPHNSHISAEEVFALEQHTGLVNTENPYPLWALSSVAISTDGNYVLSGGADGFMRLWDLDGHIEYEFEHLHRLVKVAFAPDKRHVVSGCLDGSIYLWELPAPLV